MFGNKSFAWKTVLLLCLLCVVLAESVRQKKDVHHMIVLKDKARSTRSHRHKHRSHGADRHKRRPSGKVKHSYPNYASEEGASHENFSEEKSTRHKTKTRPSKNRYHDGRHNNYRDSYSPADSFFQSQPYPTIPDINWQPISSQEFFGNAQPFNVHPTLQVFPGPYQKGSIHYSQPIPMEITTPYSLPSNSFISYESTLYPPLNSYQTFRTTTDSYKPYDYSVLEHKTTSSNWEGSNKIPIDTTTASNHPQEDKAATPFSIVVEGAEEGKEQKQNKEVKKEEGTVKGSRKKPRIRGRGESKFQWGQKEGV
ncbi:uncharacterized protein [Euwallacea fornicatus]|uniref:uncharacterized protein n=1 Tax=Euwallacea fornicatus TaxID=995702 RepID=UPI00338ED5D5